MGQSVAAGKGTANTGGTPLDQLTAITIAHYDRQARAYREGTRDHDVSQNYAALLGALEGPPPYAILDFGCGPGRDLRYFRSLGHEAVGLDGSAALVAMARAESGCTVLHQDFLALDLPAGRFDGVFANASLFHVPRPALPEVLGKLHACLKPRGVLFCSNPRGDNQEGFQGDRYGCFFDLETWRGYVTAAGFTELTHYYRPTGLPFHQQPWLATVWRKA
jgi:SAM-dependent methyltransferase